MEEGRVELASEFLSNEADSLMKRRLQLGFSQQRLAEAVGTSQSHIANLEAGKLDPKLSTLKRIKDALCLKSLDEISKLIENGKIR